MYRIRANVEIEKRSRHVKVPQNFRQRHFHTRIDGRQVPVGERGKGTWKGARRQKAEHTHLIFPLCVQQLGPSVQAHRRIRLECQCPIVQLERIVWVLEAFVDLV